MSTKFFKIISVGVLALALTVLTGGLANAVVTLNATSVTSDVALTLTGTATSTWSLSGAGAALTINSGGAAALTLDSGTTGAVNLATGASAKTITVGNAASTELELNALLVDINAGATGMTIDFGAGNLAITGTGASADFTLDADLISIDATGTSNITVTGAADEDFTIAQAGAADASLFISSTGTGADALKISTTGTSGDLWLDSEAGTVIIDAGEAVADALVLRATGGTTATAHLTSNGTGASAIDIDATGTGGDIDIDANDAIDIFAGGVFSIDGTGASNVSATSGNLTLSTITSGVLILSSAGNTTLDVAAGGLLSIDVAAPGIEVATANNISVAASDSAGVVAQTFVIELTGAEDDEDDFTIRAVGANGDLLLTSGDDLTVDAVGLLELNSSAGVISIGNDAVNQNIGIGTAGTRTITIGSATGTVNITAADASFLDLSAVLHNDTASQGLKLPNVGAAPTDPTDAGEGYIAWDETNNLLLVNTGAGWASTFNNTASANTWTDNQIYTFGADEDIVIDAATTDTTLTTGVLNIDVDTITASAIGVSLDFQVGDAAADSTYYALKNDLTIDTDADQTPTVYADYIGLTVNDATAVTYGLAIVAQDAGTQVVTAGLLIENLQATDIDITDAILIRAATDASIATALNVSDAEITTAIDVGDNIILGAAAVINFTGFDVAATTGATVIAGSAAGTAALTLSLGDLRLVDTDTTTITSVNGTTTVVLIDNAGGDQADNTAILALDAGGNNVLGSNMMRLTPSGTPVEGAIGIEFVGAGKVMQAMNLDGDSATNSVVVLNGGGALNADKAVLEVTSDGTLANGASIVRIASTTAAGGATAYGLEISANADNLQGLWVSAGLSVFAENVTITAGGLTVSAGNVLKSVASPVAAGSTQADGVALTADLNNVTGADGTKGAVLPTAVAGLDITVINQSVSTLKLYGAADAQQINGVGGETAYSIVTVTGVRCIAFSTTNWECEKSTR